MPSLLKRCLLFVVLLFVILPSLVSAEWFGHNQRGIVWGGCAPTSAANAAGDVSIYTVHDTMDEMYRNGELVNIERLKEYDPNRYRQGPYSMENVTLVMNALGYNVTRVRISPEALMNGTIPQWSIYCTGTHCFNIYSYKNGMLTLANPTYVLPLSDLLILRVSGGGAYSGQRTYEYSYPDAYIVTRR